MDFVTINSELSASTCALASDADWTGWMDWTRRADSRIRVVGRESLAERDDDGRDDIASLKNHKSDDRVPRCSKQLAVSAAVSLVSLDEEAGALSPSHLAPPR